MLKTLSLCLAISLGITISANAQNPPTPSFPVGAAGIGARYHFTSDPPNVEEAKVMVGLGAKMHKFNLAPLTPNNWTLLQTAQQDIGIASILALPFETFVFWAYSQNASNASPSPSNPTTDNVFAPQYLQTNYDEIYDLVIWLRRAATGRSSSATGRWTTRWRARAVVTPCPRR